mgnify:CR=1 FL=1
MVTVDEFNKILQSVYDKGFILVAMEDVWSEVTGEDGVVRAGAGYTGIFITPGVPFHATDAMITNFHLPESTLLMLVSAFMGREEALAAYREAVEKKYRFFSFGDACLIL